MHESLLSIKINTSIEKIFEFTINPNNTHKWIPGIEKESIESDKIEVGTIYKCISENGNVSYSEVVNIEKNTLFHLKSQDCAFEVKYLYSKIDENQSILNYYQYMSDGTELSKSLSQEHLENIKMIFEK